jgi:hypothetical protein
VEAEAGGSQVQSHPGQVSETLSQKTKMQTKGLGAWLIVECLPSMFKALGTIPSKNTHTHTHTHTPQKVPT